MTELPETCAVDMCRCGSNLCQTRHNVRTLLRSIWLGCFAQPINLDDIKRLPHSKCGAFAAMCSATKKQLKLYERYLVEQDGFAILATMETLCPLETNAVAVLSYMQCASQALTLIHKENYHETDVIRLALLVLRGPYDVVNRREAFALLQAGVKSDDTRLVALSLEEIVKYLTPTDGNRGDWVSQVKVLDALADERNFTVPLQAFGPEWAWLIRCALFLIHTTTTTTIGVPADSSITTDALHIIFAAAAAERRERARWCVGKRATSAFTESVCRSLMRAAYRHPFLCVRIARLLSVVSDGPGLMSGLVQIDDLVDWLHHIVTLQPRARRWVNTIFGSLVCTSPDEFIIHRVLASHTFRAGLTAVHRARSSSIDARSVFWVLASVLRRGTVDECELIATYEHGPAAVTRFIGWAAHTLPKKECGEAVYRLLRCPNLSFDFRLVMFYLIASGVGAALAAWWVATHILPTFLIASIGRPR
jgi:hypothetical protein